MFSMDQDPPGQDGQLHTLGLLEQLRDECKALWGTSSTLYFRIDELLRELANPKRYPDPPALERPGARQHREHRRSRGAVSELAAESSIPVTIARRAGKLVMLCQTARVLRRSDTARPGGSIAAWPRCYRAEAA